MPIDDDFRNPIILPDPSPRSRRGCPKCGKENWTGRRIQGSVRFSCLELECKNEWSGGLPQEPMDPRVPRPPEPMPPPVTFDKNPKTGQVEEIRRAVSTVPDFRKGAPISEEE